MQIIMLFLLLFYTNSSYQDQIDPKEAYCLARAIYHEARGEPIEGQMAVAQVVMNRVNSQTRYPNTVCEVVYQPHQFTDILKKEPNTDTSEWVLATEIAVFTMAGFIQSDLVGQSTHYYAHNKIKTPKWAKEKTLIAVVGNHSFYGKVN